MYSVTSFSNLTRTLEAYVYLSFERPPLNSVLENATLVCFVASEKAPTVP